MAKEAFESHAGLKITDVGFIDHPMIEYFGASPDGFEVMAGQLRLNAQLPQHTLSICLVV